MGVDFVNSVDDAAEGVGTTRINMPNCGLLFLKNCLYSMTQYVQLYNPLETLILLAMYNETQDLRYNKGMQTLEKGHRHPY